MKYILFFLYNFGFVLSIYAANPNQTKSESTQCSYFRTGIFENVCKSGHTSKFKRYSNYQIQEYNSMFLKEKIVWTGPCSYKVTLLETNDPEMIDYVGNSIKVKMVKIEKSGYQTIEEGSSGNISTCRETKVGEIQK
ncbi:hypothetical protein [Leptospira kanakyensis]|uniref:Uncharacterized protein n=1 Tax=Leptospira kanakyensis TaxID=2484968 RepID=A0A6N4PTU6_9LEPT|nr:hypothetical protein [Leptospira kanakyensis]MCW7481024.1 hypothetical protein [Leptospira kanakyensis]TGK47816.1 hypothetical protein EHQ11_18020 [Leptospira kanakyensis]TGK63184.1 hypothetical protein EHQ16_01610 [Leptospira kanakyensis]TGK66791.1 hypothetical protein EHQ18_16845 [Leptospira kanakyensis]